MSLPSDKERARERRRNFVAKNLNKVNRPVTIPSGIDYDRNYEEVMIEEGLEEWDNIESAKALDICPYCSYVDMAREELCATCKEESEYNDE